MARFEITSPDGHRYEINAPDDASHDDILAYAQANFGKPEQPAAPDDPQPEQSVARTALDQGLQGATFGFADELTDRIGAGLASLVTGEKYDDLLGEARGMSKDRMQQQMEQNPGTAIAANLAGGLLTGGAGATTKAGTAVANSLRSGNVGARVVKGAAASSASGALYGAGTAEEGHRLEGAGEGALIGLAGGALIPAAGAAIRSGASGVKNLVIGATARDPEALSAAASAIRQSSSAAYDAMRQAGAVFKPQTTKGIVAAVDGKLKADGLLNSGLHGNTLSVLDDFKAAAGQPDFGLEQLDQWRQLLGQVVTQGTSKMDGISQDARKARLVIDAIDDAVDGLGAGDLLKGNAAAFDALKDGRAEYARARKFETIANIIEGSNGDANYLKRELKKLADDKRRTRGFTGEERAALKQAASLSAGEGVMKMLGKFGIDFGGSRIGNTALPVIGGYLSGSAGLPVTGTAARQAQKYLARGKAETLLKTIEGANPGGAATQAAGRLSGAGKVAIPAVRAATGAGIIAQAAPSTVNAAEIAEIPSEEPVAVADASPIIDKMIQAESGGDPDARNPKSSASGLLQFTDRTWADMVARHGKQTGINIGDKANPEAQRVMGQLLADENARILAKATGMEPAAADIYAAHVFGAGKAANLINAVARSPERHAVTLFSRKVVDANRGLFFDRKRPRTAAELYQLLDSKVA